MQDPTRLKIRRAAETLFTERGFANTSLRAITQLAGVNLAAVNYHFGSKEALIQEIFSTNIKSLNEERISALNHLEAGGNQLSIETILDAYLRPVIVTVRQDQSELQFLRLLGRTHLGASDPLRQFVNLLYEEVLDRFRKALAVQLPAISRAELQRRLHFLRGTVIYTLAADWRTELTNSLAETGNDNQEELLASLIQFLAAGLRAAEHNTGRLD